MFFVETERKLVQSLQLKHYTVKLIIELIILII